MGHKIVFGSKAYIVADRLHHKGIYCISRQWLKWSKSYLNRVERRKIKQEAQND